MKITTKTTIELTNEEVEVVRDALSALRDQLDEQINRGELPDPLFRQAQAIDISCDRIVEKLDINDDELSE